MPAVVHFLGMLPDLTGAVAEGISTSALAGCERDCAKLAAKAMVLLQQVQISWLQHLMLELTLLPLGTMMWPAFYARAGLGCSNLQETISPRVPELLHLCARFGTQNALAVLTARCISEASCHWSTAIRTAVPSAVPASRFQSQ